MASSKTRTRTVRISNESADYFEKLPLNKVIEGVYTLISEKKIVFDGENLKISEKSGLTPEIKEIESMANFFGLTLNEMLKKIYEGLNDGTLTIENGRIVGTPDLELENFKEACHDMGVEPQKILEKAAQGVRRGTL